MKSIILPQISGTSAMPSKNVAVSRSYSSRFMRVIKASSTAMVRPEPKLRDLRVGDAREVDYEIAWTAYKRVEPHYSRTNRMLADM